MKFDMSGGAAALEATAAIARLGLPVRVVTVIGATENMPSGTRGQARRHRPRDGRHVDPDRQHRRGGPAGPRRLPAPRARARRRAARRPRDAHRRRRHRARQRLRRDVRERRRLGGARGRRGRPRRRARLAAAAARALRQGREGPLRRPRRTRPPSARPTRSPAPSSCTTSRATCRGRTSTSRASPTTAASRTWGTAAPAGACGCSWTSRTRSRRRVRRHALRSARRDRAVAPHRARLRRERGRSGGRGARPHEDVPARARAQDGRAGLDGDPVPGVRRRCRRDGAAVRDRGRGADADRFERRDHALRAHLARDAAGLPLRVRRAEGALPAGPAARAASSARSG